MPETHTDGRRARGDATRALAARTAALEATRTGLDSITVGGLAAQTGLSKSGILTVFGSREAILLASVAEARTIYLRRVIGPALEQSSGAQRLRALIDAWVAYQRDRVFPGGCFVAATSTEYGGREGAVADAVRALRTEWFDFLVAEFTAAGDADPQTSAFRLDAYLLAANNAFQISGDEAELDRARRLVLDLIDALPPTAASD